MNNLSRARRLTQMVLMWSGSWLLSCEPPPVIPAVTYQRYPNQELPAPPTPTPIPNGLPDLFCALAQRDTAALDTLVAYPLAVRGSLDSDPVVRLSRAQFYRELLPELGGLCTVFEDRAKWEERAWTASTYRMRGSWPFTGGVRGSDLEFAQDARGRWRLFRVYSQRYVEE